MPNPDPYDDLIGLAEHEEFECDAEDQELRTMHEEAERDYQLEGYWHYCDGQASANELALSFADWTMENELRYTADFVIPLPPPLDSDDIPF